MNTLRSYKRIALLAFSLLIGLSLSCVVWVRKEQRQYSLNRQLIEALKKSDTNQALALVNAGADPNTHLEPPPQPSIQELLDHLLHSSLPPVNDTPTAFLMACRQQFQEADALVQTMLAHHANINVVDDNGTTPLMMIVEDTRLQTMRLLMAQGADVNRQTKYGLTALWWAVAAKQHKAVNLLLEQGANPNNIGSQLPLHEAVFREDMEAVRQLLRYGASPDLPDNNGTTAFSYDTFQNHPNITALLRKYSKHP